MLHNRPLSENKNFWGCHTTVFQGALVRDDAVRLAIAFSNSIIKVISASAVFV